MVFEKIILDNFATYKGRNEINLEPTDDNKPIVLIGGENGCGKTSMLDAFQLALFGPSARCSNRGQLGYHDYLERCINRTSDPEEGTVLELFLRFYIGGELKRYRIRRAWSLKNNKIKERFAAFEITKNGEKFDSVFSDNWADYVEGIFPSKVAPFFLFDGEKIEQLADFENSGPLIQAAIKSLLGLHFVDQLSADLTTLEKKKHKQLATLEEKNTIELIEKELGDIDCRLLQLQKEEAHLNTLGDRLGNQLEEIELRYRQQGGELFERRSELEMKFIQSQADLAKQEEELRHIAAGSAPFLLVQNLLEDIQKQATKEDISQKSQYINQELEKRDSQLICLLKNASLGTHDVSSIIDFLEKDRKQRQDSADCECYLNLSSDAQIHLISLLKRELAMVQQELPETLNKLEIARAQVESFERSLSGVPEEASIVEIVRERERIKNELSQLKFSLKVIHDDLKKAKYAKEMKGYELKRELEKAAERRFEGKDQRRLLQYSLKSRKTLDVYRRKVIEKHLNKIEQNVLTAFQKLLRKEGLICQLKIEPDTFRLRVFNSEVEEISPERLSAGERQLLATALLWGICKTAGMPLPTIIDTPLGRLDTSHRTNLVTNYFPNASHQVMLLSTNEEIVGKYHEGLRPYTSHRYLLNHKESNGGTSISSGYFD